MAQFGRALRSGRRGRKFESCRLDQIHRHTSWPHGQAVKTTPSHGVNPGSIPGQVTKDKLLDCQQLVLRNTKKQGGNMFCLNFRAVCYCSAVGSATDS